MVAFAAAWCGPDPDAPADAGHVDARTSRVVEDTGASADITARPSMTFSTENVTVARTRPTSAHPLKPLEARNSATTPLICAGEPRGVSLTHRLLRIGDRAALRGSCEALATTRTGNSAAPCLGCSVAWKAQAADGSSADTSASSHVQAARRRGSLGVRCARVDFPGVLAWSASLARGGGGAGGAGPAAPAAADDRVGRLRIRRGRRHGHRVAAGAVLAVTQRARVDRRAPARPPATWSRAPRSPARLRPPRRRPPAAR